MTWIGIELDFGSLFSYRMPNLSPSYALASPVPSPAAFRLAIVDTAIRHTGSLDYGKEVFELVKKSPLQIEPPDKVAVLKFFIRRLKPGKKGELLQSTAVREYCHFEGTMKIYMSLSSREDKILGLLKKLNRLGTTDSLLYCVNIDKNNDPPPNRVCREPISVKIDVSNFKRRPVVTLNEINPLTTFDQVNPYSKVKRGKLYEQKLFLLPLIEERRGENWVLYRKEPFEV